MTLIPLSEALDRTFRPLYAWSPEGRQTVVLEGDDDLRSTSLDAAEAI